MGAVLFHEGSSIALSSDHRTNRSGVSNSESERITKLGGWVEDGPLCGQLEPTRGFGDIDFKRLKTRKFNKSFKGDLVIPEPEMKWFSLYDGADHILEQTNCTREISVGVSPDHYSFLVLATDGVWDAVSNCDVLSHLSDSFKTDKSLTAEMVQTASNELIRYVRQQSRKKKLAMDNTAVILVAFAPCSDPSHYHQGDSSCQLCFETPITPQTETTLRSKAACLARTKKSKTQKTQKRKKRQKGKKTKK